MVSVFNLNQKQSGAIKKVLIALAALVLVGAISFVAGYLKARWSCNKIEADKVEQSLDISQSAVRKTSQFKLETQNHITKSKQQRAEVEDACINQTMPVDLIDILNR